MERSWGRGYGHMDLNFMFLRESKKSRKRKEELFSPIDKFIYTAAKIQ